MAYLSGRSLSSFKREFQDIYGESPARWIREKRLSKAQQMLRSSSLSVADVAYSLGFENPTHLAVSSNNNTAMPRRSRKQRKIRVN